MERGSTFGIAGVFLSLLGVGLILDADWTWPGSGLIAAGAWCLWKAREDPKREGKPSA
ncbi:MAG: hypothetical protein ABIR79_02425 [Candidatus Binatia bacterium]